MRRHFLAFPKKTVFFPKKKTKKIMGKGAEQTLKEEEVLIDGRLIDVSGFKHPGGSVLKQFKNKGDATAAFREFHARSKKAAKVLKGLPQRPASAEDMKTRCRRPELTADFEKLRSELISEGYFEPSRGEIFYQLSEIVIFHVVAVYLIKCTTYFFCGLLLLATATGRCGQVNHEAGHYSLTGSVKIDGIIADICNGIGCGLSGGWWRNMHSKHHATPQKLGHDVDLDTLPLLAFNDKVLQGKKTTWLKYQAILFAPVSCLLVALFWQLFLHPRYAILTKKYFELFCMFIRYPLIFGFVLKDLSLPKALMAYLLYDQLGAAYVFINNAMSHTHKPVTNADEDLHWVEYAANHTTNITPGPIANWWMHDLNMQIEHHLFPSMPEFRHKFIVPRVKALFDKHGLHYDVRPYFTVLKATFDNLHHVGNHDEKDHKVQVKNEPLEGKNKGKKFN